MDLIYLDHNATTPPAPEVLQATLEALRDAWGNPSSVHRFGQLARQRVELARQSLARLIACKERELLFTSGGTESNNLALSGLLGHDAGHPRILITTPIEHSAIREPANALAQAGVTLLRLPVDRAGWVDPADLDAALAAHACPDATVLVSLQWANNETGLILPIHDYAAVIQRHRAASASDPRRPRILFHTDATQAVGKLPVDAPGSGVDLLTLAAHKFHGPKGVGALFLRQGVRLRPQQRGGPQERDRRGGTENTPGILGMGAAAQLALAFLADPLATSRQQALRDRLESGILAACPGAQVNSASRPRLWNTTNIAFPRLEAEAILIALSERGVCASAGAACSSGSLEPSPVLLAMGIPPVLAHGSVRFSLSRDTTPAEIDAALRIVPAVIARLARTLPDGGGGGAGSGGGGGGSTGMADTSGGVALSG